MPLEPPEAQDSMSSTAVPADDDALRKRLLSRIAVAGVAIVGLLGGLAVYDSLNKPQVPSMPKMAAAPAEPEEKARQEVVEEKAGEARPEEDKPAENAAADTGKQEEDKLAAVPSVPERSETPLAPPPAAKPLTPPATARAAAIKPSPPAAAPSRPDARREIARAAPAAPEGTQAAHAPASRPLTRAAESARRFLVQVGVFSNHANAEELVQQLQAAGIPAQVESRVQAGPFASRAEVDAARVKLKGLGIDDGILVRR